MITHVANLNEEFSKSGVILEASNTTTLDVSLPNLRYGESDPAVMRAILLISAHLLRLPSSSLTKKQKSLQASLLVKSSELINGMMDIAMGRKFTALSLLILKFHQSIIQAVWAPVDSPFLQLPHVDYSVISSIQKAHNVRIIIFSLILLSLIHFFFQ